LIEFAPGGSHDEGSRPLEKMVGMYGSGGLIRRCFGRSVSITGKVVDMEPIEIDAFEALVADALATIPDNLRAEMENVAIIIDSESPPGSLYGLYEGIPLTSRGRYAGVGPDRITLFLATISRSASTTEDLARRVRVTLLHEVGHHFGIGEARLRELGWS
jgi:predicted Zn-dependent protease with MMP-like domain